MSAGEPEVAATRPWTGPSESRVDYSHSPTTTRPEQITGARDIVRLFQCRVCSLPLRDPITLPCGRSLCRQCLPDSHERVNISYPAGAERALGLRCPFAECGREHALGDCSSDVVLSKTLRHWVDNVDRGKLRATDAEATTTVVVEVGSPEEKADLMDLDEKPSTRTVGGGKLIAAWTLTEDGQLKFDAEVRSVEVTEETIVPDGPDHDMPLFEREVLHKMQEEARSEMDCQVCYSLYYDPLTTACGHTFCRSCLQRILDHSRYCPICRRKLAMNPLVNSTICPPNERLTAITKTFWRDEVVLRKEIAEADQLGPHADYDIPLFVCTLAFPMMPTFLHIFEPRYRLMIRRCMEGDRTFGMVLPRRARQPGDTYFHDLGTLLRITNVHYYPDGRSLIETTGVSRFRVLSHGSVDGYAVGRIERIDDISLEEEEASEAREATPEVASAQSSERSSPVERLSPTGRTPPNRPSSGSPRSASERKSRSPENTTEIETMSTQRLMDYALDFVQRMQTQSVPWLTERMLTIYGECPEDPAVFPWWLASMLPVRDLEKYRLLGTSSVRDRMKICCSWIVEWETSAWSLHGCTIL